MSVHRERALQRPAMAPAIGLLLLLAGPPSVLTLLVGWPLPHLHDLQDAVALRWVAPDLAQHLGASVAWVAWLYIVACVAVAALAHLRRQTAELLLPHAISSYINTAVALFLVGTSLGGRHAAPTVSSMVTSAHLQPSAAIGLLPAPSPVIYEVRARDTLWDIAEQELGDPLRWREIWQLNAHHEMADGTHFSDPNLIRPGWRMRMPSTVERPIHQITLPASKSPAPEAAGPAAPTEAPSPMPVHEPIAAPALPSPTAPVNPRDESQQDRGSSLPAGLGLGAAAAGITALLLRRRKAAMRRRPVGMRLPLPTEDLALAERALNNKTNQESATFLAASLRLASALGVPDGDAVLHLVIDSPAGVELRFSRGTMSLPEPFQRLGTGYLLPREHFAATYAAADRVDPAPALAFIGAEERGEVYLNLESLGAVALDGEASLRQNLATQIVTSLGASPWTDLAELRLADPSFKSADLTQRAECVDLAAEVSRLSELSDHTRESVRTASAQSLAAMRWRDAEPPDGVSIVIASPDDPHVNELISLARDARTAVVAVLTGPYDGLPIVETTNEGVRLPDVEGTVRTVPVEQAHLETVRELVALTERPFVAPDAAPYDDVREQSPPDAAPAELLVRVLGPVEIDGPVPHLSPQLRDIVLYLALHRRGVSVGEMATALWPEQLRSEKTLRNRMHELRRAIGGRVSLGPGWKFDDTVTTDWAKFQSWAKGNLDDRRRALELVRGRPLRDVKGDWSALEGFESEMEASIVDLAIEVSEKLLADSEPVGAMTAARAGLLACPWEERLYRLAMRSAADRGAIGEVKTLYTELRAVLDIEADAEPDPETEATYQQLLQTARRAASVA